MCCREVAAAPPPPSPPLTTEVVLHSGIDVVLDLAWLGVNDYWLLVSIVNRQSTRRVMPPGWALQWTWNKQEVRAGHTVHSDGGGLKNEWVNLRVLQSFLEAKST